MYFRTNFELEHLNWVQIKQFIQWQYPTNEYPTTEYPTTEYLTTEYPNTKYPTTYVYPTTEYPSTYVYPTTEYLTVKYPTTEYQPNYFYWVGQNTQHNSEYLQLTVFWGQQNPVGVRTTVLVANSTHGPATNKLLNKPLIVLG